MQDRDAGLSRRAYLAAAGVAAVGLAGCQASGESESTATPPTRTAGATTSVGSSTTAGASTTTGPATDDGSPTEASTATETETTTPGEDAVSPAERSLAELDFDGDLLDTHVHWGQADSKGATDLTIDDLTARQEAHGVGGTVLFASMDFFEDDYGGTVETLDRASVDYLPFMTPGTLEQFSGEGLASLYAGHEDVFYGVGEIVYYGGPMLGKAFDAEPMPGVFEFVDRNGLVLMLHPTQEQVGGISPVLDSYTDATFLFHGYQTVRKRRAGDTADRLLANHDNLYYTYDVTEMINGLYTEASGKDDFIRRFDANRERYLERARTRLPELLDVAPDRVMWGTDVVSDWNMDPEVYDRGIDLALEVIDSLPGEHREPYAYGNAVSLFG